MRIVLKVLAAGVALLLAFGLGWVGSSLTGIGREAPLESLTDLERDFAERMQNVVLAGHFTIEGEERRDGVPELYEIARVTKLDGNRWRFEARVKYGSVDATLPMVLPVEWAGDTPMVSITDFTIPGLGDEFGARVVFYDERYAGTWDHGPYGGMMYGTISPMK
ncbi:MAG: hypothetical protein OXF27_00715 [Acidobacteria bacterium]|nr:hypothetical protein [Acidobacteriota bacterium]